MNLPATFPFDQEHECFVSSYNQMDWKGHNKSGLLLLVPTVREEEEI